MARTPEPNVHGEGYGGTAGRRFQEHSEEWIDRHPEATAGVDDDDAADRAPRRDSLAAVPIEIVREERASHTGPAPSPPTRRARLTVFAVAVWLAVAGAVLSFLLPLAGLVCFIMAGLAAVVAAILGPGEAQPERTAEPPSSSRD